MDAADGNSKAQNSIMDVAGDNSKEAHNEPGNNSKEAYNITSYLYTRILSIFRLVTS